MADDAKIETITKIVSNPQENKEGFPKEVLSGIWSRAFETSVVQQLAGSVPVSIRGNAVPVPTEAPVAGIVSEGADKPVVELSAKIKTFEPVKTAAIVILSKEAIMANPLGAFDDLEAKLSAAIAKSIDTAVIHGKDALTGNVLAGKESLMSTAKSQELDLAATAPGAMTKSLSQAYDQVVLDPDREIDFNRFLLNPKMRGVLVQSADSTGRPLYQPGGTDLTDRWGTVLGVPATFSRAVRGYGKVAEENLLGFGGDFTDALRLGFVEGLTMAQANEYAAGYDLFGRNLTAIRVEAIFAWVLRDTGAFVKLTQKAG